MARRTGTGKGYYMVASDGGVFSFGTALFEGSMGDKHLNAPVTGIAATPSGRPGFRSRSSTTTLS